ncbi:CRISPR-associated helicase/endonuclease Cas3 [Proteus columbae]|uniref:CRISPR-associated helicase/endonuclease Cas3 n=1 Tax=Proteus columbae TaxID=1987580 RepID=UPI000C1DF93D|nr:CRISPR-associated helicase/endonuclease Cas3 [Proteus columbae]
MNRDYYSYWGKFKSDNNSECYHLLPYHSLDVAAVGSILFSADTKIVKDISDFLQINAEDFSKLFYFILSLHDIGKFSSSFQYIGKNIIDKKQIPESRFSYDGKNYRHDRLGYYFWMQIKETVFSLVIPDGDYNNRKLSNGFLIMIETVLGHHGKPINKNDIEYMENFIHKNNENAAVNFACDAFKLFNPSISATFFYDKEWLGRLKQISWLLAGMATLSDWIGSNNEYFPYYKNKISLSEYWLLTLKQAEKAILSSGFKRDYQISPFISVEYNFGYKPTPLQQWAEKVPINKYPQLFILEDTTGAGKTEAALTLAHRLMEADVADGFYFGLPTMATSNAMFSRIVNYYTRLFDKNSEAPSIVLAHGASIMNEQFTSIIRDGNEQYNNRDNTASAQCYQWLSDSRKKALLATVGVGTLDQALLAMLPRRHQPLRLLGLNRKVIIFDEIHSADEFMFEIIENLLSAHLYQGGSVILLTATLSLKQRQRIINSWFDALDQPQKMIQSKSFPLATHLTYFPEVAMMEYPLESRKEVTRQVKVEIINEEQDCINIIVNAVNSGNCIVWIRNTVNDAIKAYRDINQRLPENQNNCLLFHSRFILHDRKNHEEQVLKRFGKKSTAQQRKGTVLIATQVFQESLDADADIMISDICPIDDLIQRSGRLHRHTRTMNGDYVSNIQDGRASPVLYVHAPIFTNDPISSWLTENFSSTEAVYRSPGRLWLTLRSLIQLGEIKMPHDARQLIESVYSDNTYNEIPLSLIRQENNSLGEQRAKAVKAQLQLLKLNKGYSEESSEFWTEDYYDISTRYSDIEIANILLLKKIDDNYLPWVDDSDFSIALSTVKISKNKYADKLTTVTENIKEKINKQYPQTRYLQLWIPEDDINYQYDPLIGFSERRELS